MIEFSPFRYDPETRLLYRGDEEIPLPMRVVAVLESFLKRPGQIVQKDDILASAWEGAFVGEDSLTQAVSQLRSALGDDPHRPTYIQTIPKRGYRLIAEVSAPLKSAEPVPQPTANADDAEIAVTGSPAATPERSDGNAEPPPTFAAGATVGRYELVARIGAGAMGQVWRARDTELQRDVAIKVVPDELAGEAAVIERFRREALMLAAMNHPNIATIHGVEDVNGTRFIVMELLEGETLQERLERGALPIDEALKFAVQMTRALSVAHDAGIVHRDLKPGNVTLGTDGQVKVLDFGLAKDFRSSDAAVSTDPAALTATGLPVGTAAYMSPEQAAGRPIDKRSDIFSFGCVLFEMMAGRRPFGGETASEIVAGILRDEPEWDELPGNVPAAIQRLLRRCLEKDPDRRIHDIADARIEIQESTAVISRPDTDGVTKTGDSPARVLDRSRRSLATTWGVTLLVVAAAAFTLGRSSFPEREATSASRLIRHPVSLPSNTELAGPNSFAISPDGSTLVYAARRRGEEPILYHHPLDELEGTSIPGTGGASRPFFSPDGLWVAFVKQRGLWKVSLRGGSPLFICAVPGAGLRGAQWLRDGTIIFAGPASAILEVPEQGGEARALTDAEEPERYGHRLPWALPGERGILFYAWPGDPQTGGGLVAHLDRQSGRIQEVLRGAVDARYMPTGHLIWGDQESCSILAAAFDLDSRTIQGTPTPVPEIVGCDLDIGSPYRVSGTGTLVYRPSNSGVGSLVLVDPTGNEEQVDGFENIRSVRASPVADRRLLVAEQYRSGVDSIIIIDLDRPESPILRVGDASRPVFSADGRSLFYTGYTDMTEPDPYPVHRIAVDGTGEPTPLITVGFYPHVVSVHPDGETLLYRDQDRNANWMVYVARIDELEASIGRDPKNGVAEPLVSARTATFSPDGNWVAYTSSETGQAEVYVRSFEGGRTRGPSEIVSTSGGTDPVWHPDGEELFYRNGREQFSVSFTDDEGTPRLGSPTFLFEENYLGAGYGFRRDDVMHDGTFVKIRPEDRWTIELPELVVVLNWFEELKRLVPTDGSQ